MVGIVPYVAVPLIVYGIGGLRALGKKALAVFASLAPALSYFTIPAGMEGHAPMIALVACAIGFLSWRAVSSTKVMLMSLVIAVAFVASDVAYAWYSQVGIVDFWKSAIERSFGPLISQLNTTSLALPINSINDLILSLMPAVYFYEAAFTAVAGIVGLQISRTRLGLETERFLPQYDTALWIVGVVIAGVIALAVSTFFIPYAAIIFAVGLNILFCSRVTFLLQGLAVGEWFLVKRAQGCLLPFLGIICAIWLEMLFMVLTIVGFIDVWANFRKLERAGSRNKSSA